MKKFLKKVLNKISPKIVEYIDMVIHSAAENQLNLFRSKNQQYGSYIQLKRHQKKIRRIVTGVVLAVLFVFVGLVLAPVISPQAIKPEIYIPNGKGDVLLANITKNQATIVFKTLDSANGNKPLATTAFVEAFEDSDYTKLRTKTDADQFAVTHIVPVNGLVEGKTYYIRITASDSAVVPSMETLTSWGDGSDPIKLYATGEISQQACSNIQQGNNPAVVAPPVVSKSNEVTNEQVQAQKEGLQIQDVQNENHIFAQTKVQTIVSWITNIPATTVLLYREEKSNQQNELLVSNNKNIKHAAILTTLKPNTTYYFKAKSLDDKGNEIVSDEYSLRTPQPNTTIIQKIGISFNSLISGIKP